MIRRTTKHGFTVAELLVVIAIMGTITGVVIAKYRDYGTNALLANTSENIILAFRQAQVYGVGVKGSAGCTGGTTAFDCSYGVYISAQSPNQLIIFVDNNNDGLYSGSGETVQTTTWGSSVSITNVLCDGGTCASTQGNKDGGGGGIQTTFKRPNPAATIRDDSAALYTFGTITVSNGARSNTITITKSGQISLQ